MIVNCIAHPEHADRYQVIDNETGEDIRNIAWANSDTGQYAVFRLRARTMADKGNVDLRRKAHGSFLIDEFEGDISIIDTMENPLKAPLLALLHDPEVVAALREVIE